MKIAAKIFGVMFALLGTAVAAFAVWVSMTYMDSIPILLRPVQEAQDQAQAMMDAVCRGDYETAGTLILGNPTLGVDRDPADTAGQLIWDAFVESYQYELIGDCYATDSGVAQNIRVVFLDITSVTEKLRSRSQNMLEERVANAQDVDEIYDENNEYREDFVMEVLVDAVEDALREDARQTSMEFTVNMVYRDGAWLVVSDDALMTAISGGIVK